MIEKKLSKVEEDSPLRCEGNIKTGQCPFKREPDSRFCLIHQGGTKDSARKEQVLRNYRSAVWQSRINEFADNDQIKSLREEIGILRLTLETTLDKCQDSNDLLLYSTKIADHILKIEKVVASCHRLEQSTNVLLDKTSVIQIANTMIEVIGRYITDGDILDKISNEFIDSILSTNNKMLGKKD